MSEGTKRRSGRQTYDLESLTALALDVFLDKGYDATSMEDLARAAGITKSSFYYWVSGKEELLQRGLDDALDQLFAILAEPGAVDGAATDRLRHIIARSVDVEMDHLAAVSVLLRARGNSPAELAAIKRRREFTAAIAVIVEDGVAKGEFVADVSPQLTARLLFGMINSVVEWLRPSDADQRDEIVRHVAQLTLEGIIA